MTLGNPDAPEVPGITPEPRNAAPQPETTKPGFATSEFWVVLVGMAVAALESAKGTAAGPWAVVVAAALAALYAWQRTSLKR